jgi:hypothetical protein
MNSSKTHTHKSIKIIKFIKKGISFNRIRVGRNEKKREKHFLPPT